MRIFRVLVVLFIVLCLLPVSYGEASEKKKILVVDSYHREYTWSQETNKGFCDAMLKFGYFDNREQADEYTRNNYVKTSKAVVKKLWMDK